MKSGISIVNSTPLLNAGGRVFVLNSDQRFFFGDDPVNMTGAMFETFLNEVVAHPKAREFSGAEFVRPHSFHAHVVDPVNYETYRSWQGQMGIDDYAQNFAIWPGTPTLPRGMSTVIIVIEIAASPQTYTFSGRSTWYTRWPLNTVLGQSMRDVPTAPAERINRDMRRGEDMAHEPEYVAFG